MMQEGYGVTVLVVDDGTAIMKTLCGWLNEAGYKCKVASSAEEACQALQDPACTVCVVIINACVSGTFYGIESLDRIVMLGNDSVNVVMISEDSDVGLEGITHVAHDFIAKPLVKTVLLRKIGMLIQHSWLLEGGRLENAPAAMTKEADVERTIHTPVQIVVDSIATLLGKSNLDPNLRTDAESLRNIIVQNSNLYRPLLGKATRVLDPVARSFLLHELSLYEPASAFMQQTFPSINLDEPATYELTRWAFDVFKQPDDGLLCLVKQMFVHLDLLTQFDIRSEVLERFLGTIKQLYRPNPYHNWIHAFDVTQATFCFLVQFDGRTKLTHLDCLALLVSSLCHDLSHPGVSNAHLVSTQSHLAVLYNDHAVLENFHAASLFQLLLRHEDLNIFASLTKQQQREVRKSITDCILATDMADHYEYVTRLCAKADSGNPEWDSSDADQRTLLMKCIVKMADISNAARPWDVSVEWSRRVTKEFFAQGDRERAMQLEVAPFLDRNAANVVTNSINFIDFIALPFFKNFGRLHAQFNQDVVSILLENRRRWEMKEVKEP